MATPHGGGGGHGGGHGGGGGGKGGLGTSGKVVLNVFGLFLILPLVLWWAMHREKSEEGPSGSRTSNFRVTSISRDKPVPKINESVKFTATVDLDGPWPKAGEKGYFMWKFTGPRGTAEDFTEVPVIAAHFEEAGEYVVRLTARHPETGHESVPLERRFGVIGGPRGAGSNTSPQPQAQAGVSGGSVGDFVDELFGSAAEGLRRGAEGLVPSRSSSRPPHAVDLYVGRAVGPIQLTEAWAGPWDSNGGFVRVEDGYPPGVDSVEMGLLTRKGEIIPFSGGRAPPGVEHPNLFYLRTREGFPAHQVALHLRPANDPNPDRPLTAAEKILRRGR